MLYQKILSYFFYRLTTRQTMYNFVFCRHGHSCMNVIRNVHSTNQISEIDARKLQSQFIDPELTHYGYESAKYNSKFMKTYLSSIGIDKFDYIGTSILFRTMDTVNAIFPKEKHFTVFPYLREIDETGQNRLLDNSPATATSSKKSQRDRMIKLGIPVKKFDYSIIDTLSDSELDTPGNIFKFIDWFRINFKDKDKEIINVFVVTHGGVINEIKKRISGSRGVENCELLVLRLDEEAVIPIGELKPKVTSDDYSNYSNAQYLCPSQRCLGLCNILEKPSSFKKFLSKLGKKKVPMSAFGKYIV